MEIDTQLQEVRDVVSTLSGLIYSRARLWVSGPVFMEALWWVEKLEVMVVVSSLMRLACGTVDWITTAPLAECWFEFQVLCFQSSSMLRHLRKQWMITWVRGSLLPMGNLVGIPRSWFPLGPAQLVIATWVIQWKEDAACFLCHSLSPILCHSACRISFKWVNKFPNEESFLSPKLCIIALSKLNILKFYSILYVFYWNYPSICQRQQKFSKFYP